MKSFANVSFFFVTLHVKSNFVGMKEARYLTNINLMAIKLFHSILLCLFYTMFPFVLFAQTPYDSFAPEATRPMICTPAERWMQKVLSDSVMYTIAIDTQNRTSMKYGWILMDVFGFS